MVCPLGFGDPNASANNSKCTLQITKDSYIIESNYNTLTVPKFIHPGNNNIDSPDALVSEEDIALSITQEKKDDLWVPSSLDFSDMMPIQCLFKWIHLKKGVYLIVVGCEGDDLADADESPTAAITLPNSDHETTPPHIAQRVSHFKIVSPFSTIENSKLVENYHMAHDRDELEYISLLEKTLHQGGQFYYGTNGWNLSERFFGTNKKVEHCIEENDDDSTISDKFADTEHYCWNWPTFTHVNCHEIVPAFIRGFATSTSVSMGSSPSNPSSTPHFTLAILSRISSKNAGTRYNTRGVNLNGYAANSVETEQLLINHETKKVYSFMQIRGSIPLYWTQYPSGLKYNPPIVVDEDRAQSGYLQYMNNQLQRYENIVCISLVNLKGVERPLAEAFENQFKEHNHDNVKFVPFDFHHECKGMKYENIDLVLWPQIEPQVTEYGYHVCDGSSMRAEKRQGGVPRVNCKDSLDRTNVVESAIGRKVFENWLRLEENGSILKEGERLQDLGGLLWDAFRGVWADNGDAVSTLYAGTGALKSDYTRTGKRTLRGVWQDFTNSVTRYYLNNFCDGEKQDGVNLLTGVHLVESEGESPFGRVYQGRLLRRLLGMVILGVSVGVFDSVEGGDV